MTAREAGLATVQVTVLPDGPYKVDGGLELIGRDGQPEATPEGPIYLCRCGRSGSKPYCDGTHARTGWREADCRA